MDSKILFIYLILIQTLQYSGRQKPILIMKTKSIFYYAFTSFASLLILYSVSYTDTKINVAATSDLDTVYDLKEINDSKVIYRSPSGINYEVTMDFSAEADSGMFSTDASMDCSNDFFRGTHRKKAKTSIADIGFDNYAGLNAFINTLPSDNAMINYNPPITKSVNSKRVFEEKRNARILNTFIYAIKRESDNDFHIILGNVPDDHKYLNIENSGLPGTRSTYYRKLKSVRKKFEEKFGELCSSAYRRFNPPIPVEVEGSLFYDIDHRPGIVGPAGLRPATSWEIHPVTDVEFGD